MCILENKDKITTKNKAKLIAMAIVMIVAIAISSRSCNKLISNEKKTSFRLQLAICKLKNL